LNGNTSDADMMTDLYGRAGYSTAFSIDAAELAFLRDAIFRQWMARIEAVHPGQADAFRAGGLEHYDRLSHLVSHETLWTKEHRVLPRESVATVAQFDFVRRLTAELGGVCRISNVVFFSGEVPGYPEVYWRLVRPNVATDVGALHTDNWFHQLLGSGKSLYEKDQTTIKMWLAIYSEPGLNGLYVVPGSHAKTWRVRHTPGADGYCRPELDEPLGDYARLLVPTAPGQAILFNENLLHGGAVNAGATSRVSVEMTLVLKRSTIMQ
jgi:phytanoyl-CoA dioxygenase PhyH